MAGWDDRSVEEFCRDYRPTVEDLKWLPPGLKQKFLDMLDDCAKDAKSSDGDSVAAFKQGFENYRSTAARELGLRLPPVPHAIHTAS